ncbi:hypothetical protein J6I75_11345 [Pseudidiomarina sp. 1APP75-27a]|uniref:hypothetical protein n=1 Tax=Pseudidiomarina terrestris TaxID=2820060 RepID=UPI00265087A6|nr:MULTISPECIES: hypothetical protein [unclassified Pseudidiomarina]MDN7127409.1 hypothetical protein [Pseudidiomarina sp. 1APR75-33.1]MEA3588946.1 hypothetical protein [Pseudidiomarina sp. 1APP75-27a]
MRSSVKRQSKTESKFALLVVGVGQVGSCWLENFAPQLPASAVVTSTHNSRNPLTLADIEQQRSKGRIPLVLDLTASEAVSRCYPDWIGAGADIVSANKYAGAAPSEFYQEVKAALEKHQRQWLYAATVGAGVPVPQTVRECYEAGDSVLRVEGNFSGSLTWIFQQYRPGDKLSELLRKARDAGITEPDPRTDLGGRDVAKKLLIVAREAGWDFALEDAEIQSLVLASSLDDELDAAFDHWRLTTYPDATQFCYIGRLQADEHQQVKASAALEPVSSDSPYAQLAPERAYFRVWTARDPDTPIPVEGVGAGLEATAGSVHQDVLAAIGHYSNR